MFGDSSSFLSVSRQIRMAALVFLGIELLIPLCVYIDIRQSPEESDMIWVHVAAMPVLNFFGLVAYLVDRKVKREQNE